jgi:hypothetical protein
MTEQTIAGNEPLWLRDSDRDIKEKIDAAATTTESRTEAIRRLIRDAPSPNEHESGRKRHLQAEYAVVIEVAPFTATVIGNRLWQVAEHLPDVLESECRWLARRFHQYASAAKEGDFQNDDSRSASATTRSGGATIEMRLSEFECRAIGNRLQMCGTLYESEQTYGHEADQLKGRFHEHICKRP